MLECEPLRAGNLVLSFFTAVSSTRRGKHPEASKYSINTCPMNDSGMLKVLWKQRGEIGGERKRQHLR